MAPRRFLGYSSDMRKPTAREQEEAKRLYDALAARGDRDSSQSEEQRPLPSLPGELASMVDDLLDVAHNELGLDRGETLTELIDLGLVAWFRRLDPDECERLGLPHLGADPSAIEELRAALDAERAKVAELETEIDALAQASDPDPAKVQQRLRADGSIAPGYVPMSSHSMNTQHSKKPQHPKKPQHSKKPHRSRKRSRRR